MKQKIIPESEYALLVKSFELSLLSKNLSPKTIISYLEAVHKLYEYLTAQGMPLVVANIHREHIESFIAHQLQTCKPNSALTRYRGIRIFFNWLVEEGEIKDSPMKHMKPPHSPVDSPAILTDDQLKAILKTCEGKDFISRRDMAIIRLLIDTPMRRAEITNITLDAINWDTNVILTKVKGGGMSAKPFGRKSAVALDRYIRARAKHKYSTLPNLWVGVQGALSGSMIYDIVRRRCKQAGIEGVHPHLFRHTFAHQWLASGGQEGDLMLIGGWRNRQVMSRYGQSAAAERARSRFKELSPGDRI